MSDDFEEQYRKIMDESSTPTSTPSSDSAPSYSAPASGMSTKKIVIIVVFIFIVLGVTAIILWQTGVFGKTGDDDKEPGFDNVLVEPSAMTVTPTGVALTAPSGVKQLTSAGHSGDDWAYTFSSVGGAPRLYSVDRTAIATLVVNNEKMPTDATSFMYTYPTDPTSSTQLGSMFTVSSGKDYKVQNVSSITSPLGTHQTTEDWPVTFSGSTAKPLFIVGGYYNFGASRMLYTPQVDSSGTITGMRFDKISSTATEENIHSEFKYSNPKPTFSGYDSPFAKIIESDWNVGGYLDKTNDRVVVHINTEGSYNHHGVQFIEIDNSTILDVSLNGAGTLMVIVTKNGVHLYKFVPAKNEYQSTDDRHFSPSFQGKITTCSLDSWARDSVTYCIFGNSTKDVLYYPIYNDKIVEKGGRKFDSSIASTGGLTACKYSPQSTEYLGLTVGTTSNNSFKSFVFTPEVLITAVKA